jgi:hypothetical protein
VDLIYDEFFKKDIDHVEKYGTITKEMFQRGVFSTSELTSEKSVEAHKLNPCGIVINYGYNHYNFDQNIIAISINIGALGFVLDEGGSIQRAADSLQGTEQKSFLNEFTEHKIKGSIHHELIHWIDDTMNNRHIKKSIDRANELGKDKYFKGKNINTTKLEIQAQIGNIQELKNKFSGLWNELTFVAMVGLSPALNTIYKSLDGDEKTLWVRNLKTRMYREGLLGDKMI